MTLGEIEEAAKAGPKCPHGRVSWQYCSHCHGLNKAWREAARYQLKPEPSRSDPSLTEKTLPCPHGRTSWHSCPHCLGLNDLNWQDPPESEPTPAHTPPHTPARAEGEWFGFPEMNQKHWEWFGFPDVYQKP